MHKLTFCKVNGQQYLLTGSFVSRALIASFLGVSKNCKEKKDLIVKSDKNNACKMMKTDVRFDEYGFFKTQFKS